MLLTSKSAIDYSINLLDKHVTCTFDIWESTIMSISVDARLNTMAKAQLDYVTHSFASKRRTNTQFTERHKTTTQEHNSSGNTVMEWVKYFLGGGWLRGRVVVHGVEADTLIIENKGGDIIATGLDVTGDIIIRND